MYRFIMLGVVLLCISGCSSPEKRYCKKYNELKNITATKEDLEFCEGMQHIRFEKMDKSKVKSYIECVEAAANMEAASKCPTN